VTALSFYRAPGALTTLSPERAALVSTLPADPEGICAAVRDLFIHPLDLAAAGISEERLPERAVRPADRLIGLLASLDPAPLDVPRPPGRRVVGTCRHFSTLSVALLRHRGIPARARCGFAAYFEPGRNLDHWVTEYWHDDHRRWIRIDAEFIGTEVPASTADLRAGDFLTGGEAWQRYRAGADGMTFGVMGTTNSWGPAEIRGNAIRDLAALRKLEMLPWDEWGRMTESYQGKTGADYDALMDVISATTGADDDEAIASLYSSEDLAVPPELVQ
jgi:hypothetical protein